MCLLTLWSWHQNYFLIAIRYVQVINFFFFLMQGHGTLAAGVRKVGIGVLCSQAAGAPGGFATFKQGFYGRYNLADHSKIIINPFIGF